jgi:hypothetical protein
MPGGFLNQARMTISSSGTGTFTLAAAVAPFNTFATAGAVNGQIIKYGAIDGTAGSEKGWGVYTAAGTTLTRNVLTSNNSNNPINASSSNTQVFIDPDTADLIHLTLFAHANLGGL